MNDNQAGAIGRLNCNLFRAIRMKYFWYMVKYCNKWGWKYFWYDTFNIKEVK